MVRRAEIFCPHAAKRVCRERDACFVRGQALARYLLFGPRAGLHAADPPRGFGIPAGSMGAAAGNSLWQNDDLRRACAKAGGKAGPNAHVCAGRRRRGGAQRYFAHHPLPPRGGRKRQPDWLRRRRRQKDQAARA